ncbi:hypothetical protein HMPREF9075_00061 [Capnocytophaga sp. oral taxon 332 str. F0381]|uniref:DUF4406 domain-containing protein n=1 Tax=Capnocytophaga sp. oral taxon 332 TaxID=712213 RepID=UPI0002A1C0FA|nr:DUF4406 domain-containing protein [Capnocytophaga sp. oral taxon 332]EKY13361.1 hypothetical protein HMPREF9075_00061 [Capnocytophaga sp. oral taxon 332 str. F0381]
MKIYISGKISGTDLTETRKRFAAVAKVMKRLGVEPVNPLENGLSEHDSWEAHMLKDIADLLQCKAIYMLQGWQESKGARIEYYIATKKRMPIMYEVEQAMISENE